MTLRHLRIFTAVVDCRTMHQAAESLYLSQPGISQAIRELENHYQVRLFERYKKKLILTADGEKLLKHCRVLLAEYDSLEQVMKEAREIPVIRVGATVSVGEEILVPMISAFEQEYPAIRAEVTVNNTEYVEECILNGRLDMGLIEGQVVSSDVELVPFYQDRMLVVAAPGNPLAGEQEVTPEQLSQFDIITREQGSQARNVLLNMLHDQGINVHIKWNCTNVHTIKQAVMAGQGIALLSSLVVEQEVTEGSLCVLKVKGLNGHRVIHMAQHREKYRNEALEAFWEFCGKYKGEMSPF